MSGRVSYEDPEKGEEYADALARYVGLGNPNDLPAGGASKPASMLAGMATGAAPRRIVGPTLTLGPGGASDPESAPSRAEQIAQAIAEGRDLTPFVTQPSADARPPPVKGDMMAALTDLQTQPGPGVRPPPTRLSSGIMESATQAFTGPGLLQAWRDQPRTERTPLQRISDTVEDIRNPLPDVSMSTGGLPPPAEMPSAPPSTAPKKRTVQVGRAAHVDVPNTAVAQSMDRGPGGSSAPEKPDALALAKQLQADRAKASGPDPLELALQQSRDGRLIAALTRAGGAAIGRGQGAAYDALDENADRPLQELGLRQQAADKAKAEGLADADRAKAQAAAAADADPASIQSQMARDLVTQVVPGLAKTSGFEKSSYATLARGPLAKFLDANVDLQKERIKAQGEIDKIKAKHAGAGAGGGKLLPASEAAKAGDFDAAQKSLDSLMETRKAKTGPLSGVAQFFPGTDAAQYNDAALSTAQVVGYILEGGKLSDQDLPRYLRMLPTAGDSDERARGKVENIKQLLEQKRSGQLNALGQAGYRTKALERPAPSGTPATPGKGLGRAPASEADISAMSDDELRAFLGSG